LKYNKIIMENLETEQNESPEVNQEALTQESDNSYQEVLQDKDFFALPYSERVELKKIVREKLPESGKEALDLGWTPKEMFRGKYKDGTEKPWEDANTFLTRVKEEAPVRNERMRKMAQENETYKKNQEEMQAKINKVLEINRTQLEASLLKEEAQTSRQLAEAKEMSDVDAYESALARQRSVDEQKLQLKTFEEPPLPPTAPQVPPAVQNWADNNSWIVNDPAIFGYAQGLDKDLTAQNPNMSQEEILGMITAKVKETFPLKDPTPRQTHKSSNSGASFGSKPKTLTFNDLPKIEQQQAEILIRQGAWKDKADYLKTYIKIQQNKK
tara:strand:- start:1062 stop:2042 length:981 start_codon:yes stop_codon:yes gene_type:complete